MSYPVEVDTLCSPHAGGADDLVVLDPDHPGFRDAAYRERRNTIARYALDYRDGDPVPHVTYTEDEQEVWRTVWRELGPLHEDVACRDYLDCCETVQLSRSRIPQLSDVNAILERETGFRMLPVAGLVSARTFLTYLGRDVFLATQYIRHHSRPLYTPEPDVVHELVGHAATLGHQRLAELNRLFGRAAEASSDSVVERIARVYWYTLEFGAVREDGGVKAYGAGMLSSAGELRRLASGAALRPLDLETMASTPYDPTDYQPAYFVAESSERVLEELTGWLEPLLE